MTLSNVCDIHSLILECWNFHPFFVHISSCYGLWRGELLKPIPAVVEWEVGAHPGQVSSLSQGGIYIHNKNNPNSKISHWSVISLSELSCVLGSGVIRWLEFRTPSGDTVFQTTYFLKSYQETTQTKISTPHPADRTSREEGWTGGSRHCCGRRGVSVTLTEHQHIHCLWTPQLVLVGAGKASCQSPRVNEPWKKSQRGHPQPALEIVFLKSSDHMLPWG